MLTRRKLLGKLLRGTATLAIPSGLKTFAEGAVPLPLKFGYGPPVEVPANFTGLGYEMSSVATPDLLSPSNNRYVELVRGLGPQGVLRVGGIVANYTRYIPDGPARFERQDTVITTG